MSPLITRELFERGHAVAVLPYDPKTDKVLLVEQFRIGALNAAGGPWLYEIIAGMVNEGENEQDVAIREAQEEAGVALQQLEYITRFLVSPGGTSEEVSLFCAKADLQNSEGVYGLDEEGEDIRAFSMSFAEAWYLLERGEVNSASAIIALQWLKMARSRLQVEWS